MLNGVIRSSWIFNAIIFLNHNSHCSNIFFLLFQPFYMLLSSTLFSDWLFTGNQLIWNAPIFCLHNCTGVVESKQHLPKHAPLILQGAGSQRAMIKLVAWNHHIYSTIIECSLTAKQHANRFLSFVLTIMIPLRVVVL